MFSFEKLELMNWDLWDHVVFPMDEQVVVVSGPNGSGKTTLLDAIRVLLGSKTLSTSRKMSGYLRSEVKVAVIKATVTNPLRKGHGRRPFTRRGIFEDIATVACVLESKSGAWHRRYHILPGDASMAQIQAEPRGMGPQEYAEELRVAGLPRTMLKVLALEQGETHALCRRSPNQLLEYVLELQGDKAVLDSYEAARENYALSRQEHQEQARKAKDSERALELTARDARAYEELRELQREIVDIEARQLPAARWHALGRLTEGVSLEYEQAKELVDRFDSDNAERIGRIDTLERELDRLGATVATKKSERTTLLDDKSSVDGRAREVRVRLKQLHALRQRASETPTGDPEALRRTSRAALLAEADAERRLESARARTRETEVEIAGLRTGSRPRLPRFVLDMKGALKAAGLEHSLLVEVVDVVKPRWQKAVESVLGRDRFTVLVDKRDALRAREVAAQCRYPAYVASLEAAVEVEVPSRSALEAVALKEARAPRWVKRKLADVTLVDSVDEGYRLAKEGATITADGYRQDKRGGVYVGVEDLYCGGGAGDARRERLQKGLKEAADEQRTAEEQRRAAILRRGASEKELSAFDARDEWEAARDECLELEGEDQRLIEEKRSRAQAIMDVLAEAEELTRQLAERESELKRIRHDGALGDEERRRRLVKMHDLANRLRHLQQNQKELVVDVPEDLRSEAAAELMPTEGELKGRLTSLRERETRFEGCRDPSIIDTLARRQADLDEQLGLLKRRGGELAAGEEELGHARKSYIRVADATIGRYTSALRDLGERAGMSVDVRRPRLVEDDDMLRQAGLEVRLGFDGKRPMRIADPKLSGGQKVLASLLLLVALTYEEGNEAGGFFILDEPFAHLSVERIDHVARFISRTRSQFLLTTPTTHNFAVFNAAQMMLTLRKKTPSMDAAPPPLYIRR